MWNFKFSWSLIYYHSSHRNDISYEVRKFMAILIKTTCHPRAIWSCSSGRPGDCGILDSWLCCYSSHPPFIFLQVTAFLSVLVTQRHRSPKATVKWEHKSQILTPEHTMGKLTARLTLGSTCYQITWMRLTLYKQNETKQNFA